ncbi:MAG: hypothetical protein JWQ90_4064 [Hydrocarboniphaga sp.]|nr:hypothetical protein [Hydrocarboniphaga sp.]
MITTRPTDRVPQTLPRRDARSNSQNDATAKAKSSRARMLAMSGCLQRNEAAKSEYSQLHATQAKLADEKNQSTQ